MLTTESNAIRRIVNGQMLSEPLLAPDSNTKIRSCTCDIARVRNNDNGVSFAFLYYAKAEVADNDGNTKVVNRLYRYDLDDGKFTNPKLI